MRPIYLFDDSQLLFWSNGARPFLHSILDPHLAHAPWAAYIGASNGDAPEYYGIFEAAMHSIGVVHNRMIRSDFSSDDRAFLRQADIVLLAGGDVERGWRVLDGTRMKDMLVERYQAGATLMGVSAGAVHLGRYGVQGQDGRPADIFETLKLCPFVVVPHVDRMGWPAVAEAGRLLDRTTRAVGMRAGGGLIYYPDGRLEAVRYPAYDLLFEGGTVRHATIPAAGDVTSSRGA